MVRICTLCAALALATGCLASAARAEVIEVDTLEDAIVGPVICDLRDAISAANDDLPRGGCPAGDGTDTIDMSQLQGTMTLTLGALPVLDSNLTLRGSGADDLTIDGDGLSEILRVNSGNVTIRDLRLLRGVSATTGVGGCLSVAAGSDVTLQQVWLSDCAAPSGGAIANGGTLELQRTLVETSDASAAGGGILNDNGILRVDNSTFSGNEALGSGGGIATLGAGQTRLYSSTLADNGAPTGRHLFTDAGATTTLLHVLVRAEGGEGNCDGAIDSQGYNLSTDDSCSLDAVGDLPDTLPDLDILDDNGGPTPTHALLAESVAIDAGTLAPCEGAQGGVLSTDQRGNGFPRPTDGDDDGVARCDIGAFEVFGAPEPGVAAAGLAALAALGALAGRRRP